MKNCPSCGHQNPDDAKFCEKCGTAISGNIQQPPSGTGTQGGASIGLGILSFVIPLVGIILGISYMNDSDPSKKAAGKTYLYLGLGGIALGCLVGLLSGGY